MNSILIISISIRLLAMGWSLVLLRQNRDWRMGFLTLMLALMALRQTLTLWYTHESGALLFTWHTTELPGLLVSIMALLAIFFLHRMLTEHRQAEGKISASEKKYRTLVESCPCCIHQIDRKGRLISMNRAGLRMLDLSEESDILGTPYLHAVCVEDRERIARMMETAFAGNSVEFEFHDTNGRDFRSNFVPLYGTGDEVRQLLGITLDVTEDKRAQEEIRKLSRGVEASSSGIIIADMQGIMEYVNPRFTEITGFPREEAIGQHIRILRSDETPQSTIDELWETVRQGKVWKGELRDQKKNGELYWDRASIAGIKNEKGEITHLIAIQEDVTHEYELSEQLSYHASHDALTGLVNRHEFERRTERLLATIRQDKSEHAMCYMDLDQFKIINDTCGHMAGDEMLRQLSTLLQGAVRKRDTLARLGGDEFGVLMEHCAPDNAYRVASTLQKTIQEYQFSWEGHTFKVSVSIGLVAIDATFSNLTELLKQADAACYIAKDRGRNRIHVYRGQDAKHPGRHGEMQWVTRIYQALEENRFCLYAQIIVPLGNSHDVHYELLLRMKDRQGQIIAPGAFLPEAERYNLIGQLDTWVIETTFKLLAANPAFLNQIRFISINLSGQSLSRQDFLNFIIARLDKSGIEGEKICFEITETAAISNLNKAMNFISTLRQLGCQFALDDFGSGLASFGYLKKLSVDYLKIDGMFVKDIVTDPIDRAMVKSINEIGQVMDMQTIAEFVENDEIKGMLREIGVDYAQGYGIGKPQPLEDLINRSNNVSTINIPKTK